MGHPAELPPCIVLARSQHALSDDVVATLLRCVNRARLDILNPSDLAEIDIAERALMQIRSERDRDGARPYRGVGSLPPHAAA